MHLDNSKFKEHVMVHLKFKKKKKKAKKEIVNCWSSRKLAGLLAKFHHHFIILIVVTLTLTPLLNNGIVQKSSRMDHAICKFRMKELNFMFVFYIYLISTFFLFASTQSHCFITESYSRCLSDVQVSMQLIIK
ncbi:LOW QUALITY PROTEIN: hypothetical protein KUTeg_008251 [Tegillarca granosa]|uniref:Uncharacterized protein n=1 Tax=Tegillarca granosa TaxID=220873 RepID=A0ABQ9FBR6_TEGGR|nr:LOW QUALITY PROTEIN: hypothetical protein KUTeg_008251 [Tegillarca granosa]